MQTDSVYMFILWARSHCRLHRGLTSSGYHSRLWGAASHGSPIDTHIFLSVRAQHQSEPILGGLTVTKTRRTEEPAGPQEGLSMTKVLHYQASPAPGPCSRRRVYGPEPEPMPFVTGRICI